MRGHRGWSKDCQALRPTFSPWVGGWLEGTWGGCLWGGVSGVRWGWWWCWVVEWVLVGCMVGGWLEGSLGGAYTHPPIKGHNFKIFNFMNTHPAIHPLNILKASLCYYTHTLDGSWGGCWMVDGGGVVGEFMGWVGLWWDGWLESSWGG